MKKVFFAFVVSLVSSSAFAHEGHNHDAPTLIQAPKGGIIKALDESRVEVVSKGKGIKIYVYDKNLKPMDVAGFQILASAELPRVKKTEEVKLEAKGTYLEGEFDAKNAHRYTLKLSATDPQTKRTEKLTFTIEPRK